MKTGKTLVELAKELERIESAKRDFIVDTREMRRRCGEEPRTGLRQRKTSCPKMMPIE